MFKCTAVIGSVTAAMKAQRALASASIQSTVVKLDASVTARGCAHGIEYDCNQSSNVRAILNSAGIRATRYTDGGGRL